MPAGPDPRAIEIRKILVPIDFSEPARAALAHAVAIAGWYRSTIHALHVSPPPVPMYPTSLVPEPAIPPPPPGEPMDALRSFLETATSWGVPIEPAVIEGAPVPSILDRARELPADLLIMGTHGRGGFDRLVLGSVTEKILRKSPCPLMTISPRAGEAHPRPLFKTILAATDFSAASDEAVAYALSLAGEADARLILLHAVEWLPAQDEEPRADDALARLRDAVPASVREWLQTEERVTEGRAYKEILRMAAHEGAELIVVGTQGRGALDAMFFGSTAQHVVREAACPVLTVRAG